MLIESFVSIIFGHFFLARLVLLVKSLKTSTCPLRNWHYRRRIRLVPILWASHRRALKANGRRYSFPSKSLRTSISMIVFLRFLGSPLQLLLLISRYRVQAQSSLCQFFAAKKMQPLVSNGRAIMKMPKLTTPHHLLIRNCWKGY